MFNPFKHDQEKAIREEQKEQADYQMSMASLGAQQHEEDLAAQRKREVLMQLTQWQQDRNPALRQLFLKLSGYEMTDGKLEPSKWDKGHVSLIGAQKLVNYIEPLDHNVMLANWQDKTLIITMREAIAHPLRRYIFTNHEELGLQLQHAEYVFWLIINTVEATYWRGWNDGERRKDREIIKVNELRNPYYQEKAKKGIFGMEA